MDEPLGAPSTSNLASTMAVRDQHISDNLGITVVYVTPDQDRGADHVRPRRIFEDGTQSSQAGAARRTLRAAAKQLRSPSSSAKTTR